MLHHIEAGKLVSELAMVARYAQHIPGTVSCSLRRFRPWREIITEYGLATLMAELAQDIVGDGIIESAVWAMDLAGFTHGCRAGWLPWWLGEDQTPPLFTLKTSSRGNAVPSGPGDRIGVAQTGPRHRPCATSVRSEADGHRAFGWS